MVILQLLPPVHRKGDGAGLLPHATMENKKKKHYSPNSERHRTATVTKAEVKVTKLPNSWQRSLQKATRRLQCQLPRARTASGWAQPLSSSRASNASSVVLLGTEMCVYFATYPNYLRLTKKNATLLSKQRAI